MAPREWRMSSPRTRYTTYSEMFLACSPMRSSARGPHGVDAAYDFIRLRLHVGDRVSEHLVVAVVHGLVCCDQGSGGIYIQPRQRIQRIAQHGLDFGVQRSNVGILVCRVFQH